MQDMPSSITSLWATGAALAGEQPFIAVDRAAMVEPFLHGRCCLWVQCDRGSLELAFSRAALKVDSRKNGVTVVDLAHTESQDFRDSHSGPHAQYDQGAIAPAVPAFEL